MNYLLTSTRPLLKSMKTMILTMKIWPRLTKETYNLSLSTNIRIMNKLKRRPSLTIT